MPQTSSFIPSLSRRDVIHTLEEFSSSQAVRQNPATSTVLKENVQRPVPLLLQQPLLLPPGSSAILHTTGCFIHPTVSMMCGKYPPHESTWGVWKAWTILTLHSRRAYFTNIKRNICLFVCLFLFSLHIFTPWHLFRPYLLRWQRSILGIV
jgi:hypothetical protein